jgi:hypothetical protein
MVLLLQKSGNLMVKEAISLTLDRAYLPLTCTFDFLIMRSNLFKVARLIKTPVAPVSSRPKITDFPDLTASWTQISVLMSLSIFLGFS